MIPYWSLGNEWSALVSCLSRILFQSCCRSSSYLTCCFFHACCHHRFHKSRRKPSFSVMSQLAMPYVLVSYSVRVITTSYPHFESGLNWAHFSLSHSNKVEHSETVWCFATPLWQSHLSVMLLQTWQEYQFLWLYMQKGLRFHPVWPMLSLYSATNMTPSNVRILLTAPHLEQIWACTRTLKSQLSVPWLYASFALLLHT